MEALNLLVLGLGAAWASGINLYAAVLLLGGLHAFGIVLRIGLKSMSRKPLAEIDMAPLFP